MDYSFIEILACPSCQSDVALSGEQIICQNEGCSLKYPVRNGIPVMLIEEASK